MTRESADNSIARSAASASVRADRQVEEPSHGYQQCDYNDDDQREETRSSEIGHLLPLWKRSGQGV